MDDYNDVSGPQDYENFPQGVWATAVSAVDGDTAYENAVAEMEDEDKA